MPLLPQDMSVQDFADRDRPDLEIDLEIELVNRAVDQAVRLRESVDRIADPLLRTLTDTLLFELGRRLARLEDK